MHTGLSRFQAFAIHILLSSAILGAFLAVVFFIWYPQPFFVVEGLMQIVWVLVGVDIVLGPTLTLVVFKSGKPGLKRDLSIIAVIQIIGFIYGAHTFFVERPAFAVMYDRDYFDVIPASDMKDLSRIDSALGYSTIGGPLYVFVDGPTEIEDLRAILEDMKQGGAYIDRRPEFYRSLKGFVKRKFEFSQDLNELQKVAANEAAIRRFKEEYGERVVDFAYFPISGKVTSRLLVIDQNTEEVVDYIDINPHK
ncbi:MAG: hypothetical protein GY784_14625 [Gammaproteobacteria bacterium]|nr:hypothetical protein [Gammaproteobacteria bacterium]